MKSIKKCGMLLLVLFLFTTYVYAIDAPQISANSAILVEPISGEILYEKNIHEKAYPASTTKMMTGLLAMESGKLDDVITIDASVFKDLEETGQRREPP